MFLRTLLHPSSRRHKPEVLDLNLHRRQNLKSRFLVFSKTDDTKAAFELDNQKDFPKIFYPHITNFNCESTPTSCTDRNALKYFFLLKRHLQSFADLWPTLMGFSIYI